MILSSNPSLPIDFVRYQFPALDSYWAFFDNAGGTQILQQVIDRTKDYWLSTNVQLGGPYELSQRAGDRATVGREGIATLMNAQPQEVILGASASSLLRMLASCVGQTWKAGDEVIVTLCDHEANIAPWVDLERWGIGVKFWPLNAETLMLDLADLEPLISDRTRLVAFTHTSNILGTIHPVKEMTAWIHDRGAKVCVDGVSYAPHRLMDVRDWDVDFYVFSCYQVYGPSMGVLYGKQEHWEQMPGYNHGFLTTIPDKFQPGGVNNAFTYGMVGLCDYLEELGKQVGSAAKDLRDCMEQAFELIADHETDLGEQLLDFLNEHTRVRLIGSDTMALDDRVPTFSFVVENKDSALIPEALAAHHIGIRSGHFYAKRLVESLGLMDCGGVVRVSLVHYNTVEEVDRLIEQLIPLL
jgi:cysteine desulfurase family protein (TIGR01976 family)